MDAMDAMDGPAAGSPPPVTPALAWAWLALPPERLLQDCRQSRFQGSGPGGQKRNRVYSGVRLAHAASGLTAECVDSRDAARNVGEALARLRLALALAAVPPPAPGNVDAILPGGTASQGNADVPPPAVAPRQAGPGLSPADPGAGSPFRPGANPGHPDYARGALRALALLRASGGQLAPAAAALGCTASALARSLKAEKAVWARARDIRVGNGLHPLK